MSRLSLLAPLLFFACTCGPAGAPPRLSVLPSAIDFGERLPGFSQAAQLTLTNTGGQMLRIESATLDGTQASVFRFDGVPEELSSGDAAAMTVSFVPPSAEGSYAATLVFRTNSLETPEVTVELQGVSSLNCSFGRTACSGACLDLSTNVEHCGACNNKCAAGQACVSSACQCVPVTCAFLSKDCGTLPDGCGGTLACGPCSGTQVCGGGDSLNVCGEGRVCSPHRLCWEQPLPTGTPVRGLFALSSNAVWAVGDHGLVMRWDGARWTGFPSGTTSTLRSVWAASASEAWAVGDDGVVLRFDGQEWVGSTQSTGALRGVWGAGASNVWAVGALGRIQHWNGTGWAEASSGVDAGLRAVHGSGASDVWAVGENGTALRWNGSSWQPTTTNDARALNAVRAVSPTEAWAAGEGGVLLHFQSGSWSAPASGTGEPLHALGGTGGALVAVGAQGWVVPVSGGASQLSGNPNLYAVSDDLWAGGERLERSDGGAWSTFTTRAVSEGTTLNRVHGISKTELWAIGGDPSGPTGAALHGGGSGWSFESMPLARVYHGLWVGSATDAWAVGEGGAIARWNGSSWANVTSPTAQHLYDVAALGANVFAVGAQGTLIRSTSGVWNDEAHPAGTAELRAIALASPTRAFAVGANGVALQWNGSTWSTLATSTTERLLDVAIITQNDVWAVGENGTVLRATGGAFAAVPFPHATRLSGVFPVAADQVWVVGDQGAVYLWNGSAWSARESGTRRDLKHIWGLGADDFWIVGEGGALLRHRP